MIEAAEVMEYGVAGLAISAVIACTHIFRQALNRRDDHIDHLVDKHDSQQRYIADKNERCSNRLSDAINELTKEIAAGHTKDVRKWNEGSTQIQDSPIRNVR